MSLHAVITIERERERSLRTGPFVGRRALRTVTVNIDISSSRATRQAGLKRGFIEASPAS